MISFAETRWKKVVASGVGRITSDPTYKTIGEAQTPVCQFFVQSDQKGKGMDKEYDSYMVSVWNEQAAYASQFEKGDNVFLFGECKKDKYWSERKGKDEYGINVQFIVPTNIGETVLQLQQVMQTLNEQPTVKNTKPQESDPNGFYDYDSMNLPDELKDIEPSI